MTDNEKLDYTLKALYIATKNGKMLKIISAFESNGEKLTIEELRNIKVIIETLGYAVFQVEAGGIDYRAQIRQPGIVFVESNSFSQPGKSILNI
jgi:hypothetical protein